jgi:hypothetical protein
MNSLDNAPVPPATESGEINARVRELLAPSHQAIDALSDELVQWLQWQAAKVSTEFGGNESARIADLLAENQQLLQLNAKLESRLQDSSAPKEIQDLQKLYEMSCDEIRELKSQLEEISTAAAAEPNAAEDDVLDWEAAKRRMMAELEMEDGLTEPDLGKIDRIVAQTDQLVAEKDGEIGRLRNQLEMTGGGKVIESLLEDCDVVRQERERLSKLQTEWEEKLRAAEIEISIERAKISREIAAQQEQLRNLEDMARAQTSADSEDSAPTRGRWLARLGLGEE